MQILKPVPMEIINPPTTTIIQIMDIRQEKEFRDMKNDLADCKEGMKGMEKEIKELKEALQDIIESGGDVNIAYTALEKGSGR